jgi:hypothetical protein
MDFHLIILYRAERVNKEIKVFALAGRRFVEVCRIPGCYPGLGLVGLSARRWSVESEE